MLFPLPIAALPDPTAGRIRTWHGVNKRFAIFPREVEAHAKSDKLRGRDRERGGLARERWARVAWRL